MYMLLRKKSRTTFKFLPTLIFLLPPLSPPPQAAEARKMGIDGLDSVERGQDASPKIKLPAGGQGRVGKFSKSPAVDGKGSGGVAAVSKANAALNSTATARSASPNGA